MSCVDPGCTAQTNCSPSSHFLGKHRRCVGCSRLQCCRTTCRRDRRRSGLQRGKRHTSRFRRRRLEPPDQTNLAMTNRFLLRGRQSMSHWYWSRTTCRLAHRRWHPRTDKCVGHPMNHWPDQSRWIDSTLRLRRGRHSRTYCQKPLGTTCLQDRRH